MTITNEERSRRARAVIRKQLTVGARRGQQLVVGPPIAITPKKRITTMASRLSALPPPPLPEKPKEALEEIATILGFPDATDPAAVLDACKAVVDVVAAAAPAAADAEARLVGLSASELRAIKSTPGATVASFVAAKNRFRAPTRR